MTFSRTVLAGLLFICGCATSQNSNSLRAPSSTGPKVTIETSGDLYPSSDNALVQIDFFGSCTNDKGHITIEVEEKPKHVNCNNSAYKYSHFFSKKIYNSSTKAYHLTKLKAYHKGGRDEAASSWILLDLRSQVVKTVLNKQIRYEKIPTGELEPVTEFNAFGTCAEDSKVKIDISGLDRYGQRVSRYDDQKSCENSGFYFLSQIDGVSLRGMEFHIFETPGKAPTTDRAVASETKELLTKPFEWTTKMN